MVNEKGNRHDWMNIKVKMVYMYVVWYSVIFAPIHSVQQQK